MIQVIQRDQERACIGIEFRLQFVTVIVGGTVGFRDLLKSTALAFHIAQSTENIGKDGIVACGRNIGYISFMYPCSVCHATGRSNGKAVIVNVNMDFVAQNQIITVEQRIDQSFKNAYFNTGIGCFLPTGFHIPLYKAYALIEQNNQAAGILCTVKRIHHATTFIKTVLSSTEQAGVLDGSIIRKQIACVGQPTVFIPHFKGIKQLFLHAVASPKLVAFTQLGKGVVLEIVLGIQRIIGAIHTFEKKLIQYIRWSITLSLPIRIHASVIPSAL